ncbi:C2H2 type zinc-finger-domain-containing protein [Stachybotrys elegans]|uniref:C2H2 type zinc-finger-domain-containing protein n=1 Tax=Stachybotrys elegans TaxID=80388 RepID=A0A8K0WNR5_9HYPO|nr:C2H2 type zinc-finger-domain-containing protein [Stachybotrys elegans]
MVLDTTTTTTTTATQTMDLDLHANNTTVTTVQDHDQSTTMSLSSTDDWFDESQCLFCNEVALDLDQNLLHMAKAHGFHVDTTNLLADVDLLLNYFHLLISEHHQCLYCQTQRSTRQAAQQHMMAKGHCKYEVTEDDVELMEFYSVSPSKEVEDIRQEFLSARASNSQLPPVPKSRETRRAKRSTEHGRTSAISSSHEQPSQPQSDSESDSSATDTDAPRALSNRALKQEHILAKHLAQLRAQDRNSLAHLPVSEQRALVMASLKQMESGRRAENVHQSNLESAANRFGCLRKIRLIRKPPHTGNIHSLKR